MAVGALVVTIESDAVSDAVNALQAAHLALAKRHGERFRALERKIEAVVEGEFPLTFPPLAALGPGLLIIGAPVEISALLAEARVLGVM